MANSILKINNLNKTFNPNSATEHIALKDVCLDVELSDFICIIGSNGAGKSTLFNCIAGSILPDNGQIVLDNNDITFESDYKRSRDISRVFQDPLLGTAPNLTVAENISLALGRQTRQNPFHFAMSNDKREKIKSTLSTFNIGLENRLDVKVGTLSGGQRQTVCLLMAVIGNPKLLLLDEHTAALDPKATMRVLEITNEAISLNRTTTMMITHNMADALEYGNRTIVMHNGKIIADISGETRKKTTVDDLLLLFEENAGEKLTDDKIRLA